MNEQRERYDQLKVQRQANGRWLPGSRGGPGRMSRASEARYLARLTALLTDDEWARVVSSAIERAAEGDAVARQWLSNYAIGRPRSADERQLDDQLDAAWVRLGVALDNDGGPAEESAAPDGDR